MENKDSGQGNTHQESSVRNHAANSTNVVQGRDFWGDINIHAPEAVQHLPPLVNVNVESAGILTLDTDPPETIFPSGYRISLLIEGRGSSATILRSLAPNVQSKHSPRDVFESTLTAAALPPRHHTLKFNGDRWELWSADQSEFSYYVSPNSPEYFVISVETTRDEVDFYLDLEWVCQGKSGTVKIDHNGEPFQVHPWL